MTETGYVTLAERAPDPALYPDADPDLLVPGSLVFQRTEGPVRLDDVRAWWAYVPGACWTAPEGPGSSTRGRHRHPVTHVAYEDALAYAQWAGKDLPTEAEWEYAARGGLDRKRFAWGDEITVGGRMMANWWQGQFPWQNTLEDGYERTSPVGAFAPNRFGLYDARPGMLRRVRLLEVLDGSGSVALTVLNAGALYRVELDGSCTSVLTGLTIANGIRWSPDGSTMYLNDSGTAASTRAASTATAGRSPTAARSCTATDDR